MLTLQQVLHMMWNDHYSFDVSTSQKNHTYSDWLNSIPSSSFLSTVIPNYCYNEEHLYIPDAMRHYNELIRGLSPFQWEGH